LSKRKKKKTDQAVSSDSPEPQSDENASAVQTDGFVLRHLRIGWWSLLIFLTLGIVLESMHGFKVQWYLGEQNATRRLMFTLAHVHGTLLSLVHLGFATSNFILRKPPAKRSKTIRSWLLSLATILMPGGFFLGGWKIFDGDPSLGVLLVPLGAACLFAAVFLQAFQLGLRETK